LRRDLDHDLDDVVPFFQKISSYSNASHYGKLSSRNGAPNDIDHTYSSTSAPFLSLISGKRDIGRLVFLDRKRKSKVSQTPPSLEA
jgi:hypothetical protein